MHLTHLTLASLLASAFASPLPAPHSGVVHTPDGDFKADKRDEVHHHHHHMDMPNMEADTKMPTKRDAEEVHHHHHMTNTEMDMPMPMKRDAHTGFMHTPDGDIPIDMAKRDMPEMDMPMKRDENEVHHHDHMMDSDMEMKMPMKRDMEVHHHHMEPAMDMSNMDMDMPMKRDAAAHEGRMHVDEKMGEVREDAEADVYGELW